MLKTFVNGSRRGNHRSLPIGSGGNMNVTGVIVDALWQTFVLDRGILLSLRCSCMGPNPAKVLRLKGGAKLCLKKIDQNLVFSVCV